MLKKYEILDLFGKAIIKNVFDMEFASNSKQIDDFLSQNCFSKLEDIEKQALKKNLEYLLFYKIYYSIERFLYNFDHIEKNFTITYKADGRNIDIVEMYTEGLFSELFLDSGWVFRYSEKLTDDMKMMIKEKLDW